MRVLVRTLVALAVLATTAVAVVYSAGRGWLGSTWGAGEVTPFVIPRSVIADREQVQKESSTRVGVANPKQVLFGDLHVHTSFSADGFMLGLPLAGGDGARTVSDACNFVRYCSGLDFWSINDHAESSTPRRWHETIESIRQCNAVAGDPSNPDVVAFLGWEWSHMGTTPANHYGHKNVVLRDLDAERIPTRPIAADSPADFFQSLPTMALGVLPLAAADLTYLDVPNYLQEGAAVPRCPAGVPVRELPEDCREYAATPAELFEKLDDWGHEALVIPHGTTWGMYTPPGSSWDSQLDARLHDPKRQTLVEVFSGHGNSEEYRDWREVILGADGTRSCPAPSADFLPSCWQAGEIVRERCRASGASDEVCEGRTAEARQHYLDALSSQGHLSVPGARPEEWLDSGQCRDCYLPAFNYRPRSSIQYMLALRSFDETAGSLGFRFGFIASSDSHTARPGTGYKEFARTEMTDARLARDFLPLRKREEEPVPYSRAVVGQDFLPTEWIERERVASFFFTGGLVAVHAEGRSRDAIWEALERKEVYGTSGPRILLWFDLLNGPGGQRLPMGSDVAMSWAPAFEVRTVGSLAQKQGCPDYTKGALSGDRLDRLCQGDCYHPSDGRRLITRIEVVRIRPRFRPDEPVGPLVQDPWRVFSCEADLAGCVVRFTDEEFSAMRRDTLYYVRAVEQPSFAVNADLLRCELDESGQCAKTHPCVDIPDSDDCLAENEERAWSSPIFVDFLRPRGSARSRR
jgi:hypothetical protein